MSPFSKLRNNGGPIIRLYLLALCCAALFASRAGELKPGGETSVDIHLLGGPMQVFLPANFAPTNPWPVIFFYPGQDQQPQTVAIRTFCDERDYIIVGLPYPDAGPAPKSSTVPPRYVERLRADLAKARTWAVANAHADAKRVFLGGVSKGGWTASLIGEPELPGVAGLIILLAGRSYPMNEAPGGGAYYGKPVYLGAGEHDANLRPARQAYEFFSRRKATVTLEEFPGLGHALPDEAPRLRAWLEVQGRMALQTEADIRAVGAWFTNRLVEANGTTDQGAKYRIFRDVAGDPRFVLCTHDQLSLARDLVTAAANLSPGREEWAAEKGYRQLLWLEGNLRTLDELRTVRDGFQKLATDYPKTKFGGLAAGDVKFVEAAYQKSLEATRAANAGSAAGAATRVAPQFPAQPKSDRPTGVRREGNKIIFSR